MSQSINPNKAIQVIANTTSTKNRSGNNRANAIVKTSFDIVVIDVDGDDNDDDYDYNLVENINDDYYSGQQQQHCIFIRNNK